jgi:hypothetical protein
MTHMSPSPGGIGEEQLQEAAPLVRSLVVQRLETIWRTCQPHIDGTGGKPDPRFVEAGIRVLDRLMRLYRLDAPAASQQAVGVVVDAPAALDAALGQLGERMGGPASP